MTNANKAKGTAFEREVRHYLQDGDIDAIKPYAEGRHDVGDIHADGWTLQAKNWRSFADAIREGLDGAETQRVHSGLPFAAAVVKRARANISRSYVILTLETFRRVLQLLRRVPPPEDVPPA